MLPPLLSSQRFQLLSLILCYFYRPSYLVRMISTAFCGVTKPPNLTVSHGWMLWGYVKSWAWLCHCTSRSSESEDIGTQKQRWVFTLEQGAPEIFPPLFIFVFFFTFLVALLAPVTECLLTTQQTLWDTLRQNSGVLKNFNVCNTNLQQTFLYSSRGKRDFVSAISF